MSREQLEIKHNLQLKYFKSGLESRKLADWKAENWLLPAFLSIISKNFQSQVDFFFFLTFYTIGHYWSVLKDQIFSYPKQECYSKSQLAVRSPDSTPINRKHLLFIWGTSIFGTFKNLFKNLKRNRNNSGKQGTRCS